jgi:hypothetical protein
MMPHVLRTLQCFRTMIDSKKVFPQILNAGKYAFAIIVAVTSFFATPGSIYSNIWWLFALVSTVYSYCWDLKMDFGFLQEGSVNYPLRDKLSYKNKAFYYFCMIFNLFLRFMWVLTVSPDIVYKFILPEFFLLIIYSMEVLRRGMWNFIRVELKHLELCKEFKVSLDVELPFKKNEKGQFKLRNMNLVEIPRINRRMDKIRSSKFVEGIKRESVKSNALSVTRSKSKNNLTKEYDDIDFRKKFTSYIKTVNEKTQNLVTNVSSENNNSSEADSPFNIETIKNNFFRRFSYKQNK